MRVSCLGSGSRGNSVLVEAGRTRVLVDAGFSGRSLARRLAALDRDPAGIDALLVTHEHRDHTSGAGIAARRWGWPLLMTRATARACDGLLQGSESLVAFEAGSQFELGDLTVSAVPTCHDAADPVAFVVTERSSGLTVGIATDLGRATVPVRAALAGCQFLVLEANHDEVRLRDSPYPWPVKQRIGGSRGHLSNRLAGELAADLLHPDLGGVLLAHLSVECNAPELALAEVRREIRRARRDWRGGLAVAGQDAPTPLIDVAAAARRGEAQLPLFPGR
ncbi:MAG: MBL fold metallo-hydrolase [Gemmatimonadota bacterium]|nr:MBL fold metallo-hydrolase [Gemmatimonadota bacterium]